MTDLQNRPQEPGNREAQSRINRRAGADGSQTEAPYRGQQRAPQQESAGQKKQPSFLKKHAMKIAFCGALSFTAGGSFAIPFLLS